MNCTKIYATGNTIASAVAQVVMPARATIRRVQASATLASIVNATNATLELSKASASEIAVNGSQQAICEIRMYLNFVTSGLTPVMVNQTFPVDVPVIQGQIIYLHASANATYFCTMLIWWS